MLKKPQILKLSVAAPARDAGDAADTAQHKRSEREMLLLMGCYQKEMGRISSCLGHNGKPRQKNIEQTLNFCRTVTDVT